MRTINNDIVHRPMFGWHVRKGHASSFGSGSRETLPAAKPACDGVSYTNM